MINIKNKKGQLTIYIIVAILIIAAVVLIFIAIRRPATISITPESDPKSFINKCVKDSINEAVDKMLPQGGFLSPRNFKLYKNVKIEYLCENIGNYLPCINQHPMLLNEIKSEIEGHITPLIDDCFKQLKTELEKRQNTVELGQMTLDVSLGPNRIKTDIKRKISISSNGETQNFQSFNSEIISPIYDLALVSMEIANQEAKYCYFEYLGYMVLYPRFSIEKTSMSDSTKIYTIIDTYSNKEMNIATRSCAIPPGI